MLGDVFLNGGCYGQQLVYFNTPTGSTPDTTPLTVISVSPANGATNVGHNQSVSVTFNNSINPYTVFNNSNNALLFAGQSLLDRGSITMSPDNRTITFNVGRARRQHNLHHRHAPRAASRPSGNSLASYVHQHLHHHGVNPATGNGGVAESRLRATTQPVFQPTRC